MNKENLNDKELIKKLLEENEALKKELKKTHKRVNSIIKINDRTFKSIFNKKNSLEKNVNRFNKILHLSDKQSKSILIEKETKEELLSNKLKTAAIGEMIDNIAHQWKQPLNAISAHIQNVHVRYMLQKLDDQTMKNFDEKSKELIGYMATTIDVFQSFLMDNKSYGSFQIDQTIEKLLILTQNILSQNNIELKLNIQKYELNGIENELLQVLMSLISNATEAFENKTKKKLIWINTYTKDSCILLEIMDNAGGIKEENLCNVFDYRFSTKTNQGGSGVGLHIAKKIIQDTFKGTIQASNEIVHFENEKYSCAKFIIEIPKKGKTIESKEKLINEWKLLRVKYFNIYEEDRIKFDKLCSHHPLYNSVVKHFDKSFKEVNQIAVQEIEEYLKSTK